MRPNRSRFARWGLAALSLCPLLLVADGARAQVINEFSASHVSSDTREYVEIVGAASTDYSALRIVVLEGDSPAGQIERSFTPGTTDASGFWHTGFLAQDSLENGSLTLLLVDGYTGVNGTDLDTNDDGVLDVTPWATILDAISVSDGGANDRAYGTPVLTVAFDGLSFAPGGASRIPNGTDTDAVADWKRNDFDLAGIAGFTGTPVAPEALNTPGATNQAVIAQPTLTLTAPAATPEGDTASCTTTPFEFTVTANPAPTSDLAFNWSTGDGSATDGDPVGEDPDYTGVPAGVGTVLANQTSATVTVLVACDDVDELDETFTAALTAGTGYTVGAAGSAEATIVSDDVPAGPTASIDDVTVLEGDGGTVTATFTVTLSAAPIDTVTLDWATANGTATAGDDYDTASGTLVFDGATTSQTLDVTVRGDVLDESDEDYAVTLTVVGGTVTLADASGRGEITDDDISGWVINEIHADPSSTLGDANGDGTSSTSQDEFVEIVNRTGAAQDISSWTVTHNGTVRHVFPAGTVVPDNCPVVLFSGAVAIGTFGDAVVQRSSSSLGLANGGATLALRDASTATQSSYTYGSEAGSDQSITRAPDSTGLTLVQHTTAAGSGGARFSPGVRVDGSRFPGCPTRPDVSIAAIQGTGSRSPLEGDPVSTTGIVTAVTSTGFFIQEPDASVDADPNSSEGVLVFTNIAPPAAAAVGNLVTVTGNVVEFTPGADPFQPPVTELVSPYTVTLVSAAQPLPAAIALVAGDLEPAGGVEQLEHLEGMRVSTPLLTVVAPTDGFVNEQTATSTSDGLFQAVMGGSRPFREPGLEEPETPPTGSIPPIPRYDGNPERLRVDSDRQIGASAIDVSVGATVDGLVGVLDYGFRTWTLLPDPGLAPTVTPGMTTTVVADPTADEFTVATYNMERFFNASSADGGVNVDPAAHVLRREKAARGIVDHLKLPDVLGVVEVETLAVLQDIASSVNDYALAQALPNPNYQAYLLDTPGSDIEVGFLVKTGEVAAGVPRVEVSGAPTRFGVADVLMCPDRVTPTTDVLNDRPSLILDVVVNFADGRTMPVTVIANHLRSLIDIASTAAPPTGFECFASRGERVREKRQQQAEFLADLVQQMQQDDPGRAVVLVGDFNAFQFNDGYVDVMNTLVGTPTADAATVVAGDGTDLVEPSLINLTLESEPADRYSFVFGGNAQTLDHVLINQALADAIVARRTEHARINADFPEINRGDASTASRLSDHDPVVAYFEIAPLNTAPALSAIDDPSIDEDTTTGALAFTVTDDSALDCADVTVDSGDTALIPLSSIVVAGSGGACTVTVAPAADRNGTTTVTLGIDDGEFGDTSAFTITVSAVNDAPRFTAGGDVTVGEDSGAYAAAWAGDIAPGPVTAVDETTQSVAFTAEVDSTTGTLAFATPPAIDGAGQLTFTPAADTHGTASIDVALCDDGGGVPAEIACSTLVGFTLTVSPVNDAPTLSEIADLGIDEDTDTGPLAFTVSDVDSTLDCADVTADSSNEGLLPDAALVIASDGPGCTLTATPVADGAGAAVVTLSVSDGTDTATTDFELQVNGINDVPTIAVIADQTVAEDATTGPIAVTLDDREDDLACTSLTVEAADPVLLPAGGIQIGGGFDACTLTLTPAADRIGSTEVTVTIADTQDATATRTFVLEVDGVNDAPAFTAQGDVVRPFGSTAAQTVPGWVTAVDLGANEDSQSVLDYLVSETADPDEVIAAVDVANDGTLSFTLTGTPGTATVQVAVRDDGGAPGVDTSAPLSFTITLQEDPLSDAVDLQATIGNGVGVLVDGEAVIYTIEIANGGPADATGAAVAHTLPATLIDAEWVCDAVGTTCPAAAGSGSIAAVVDLPVDARLTWTLIATVNGAAGATVEHTVAVAPAAGIDDVDPRDNAATDADGIGADLIFGTMVGGGFESPSATLADPASAKTRRLLDGRD